MSKNLQSPTKLTEFAPLQQEEKPQSVGQFISKFFKIAKTEDLPSSGNNAPEEAASTWNKDLDQTPCDSNVPDIYPVDLNEGRSLPNVLKRISNLLALKSNDYSTTELKQYWMPDSVSKECYECSEKFTTFRRRHHCRVCGQIFCSQCCNQQIPGKIFGCTGDLRVCTYCCKVVLSYLQSSNFGANLSADLRALQENLQSKFGDSPSGTFSNDTSSNSTLNIAESNEGLRRKISVGYQEETFASESPVTYLTSEEKCRALQNSVSLRNLFEEICKPATGINFSTYKHRLKSHSECFLGSELVDWLICQQKAKTRIQAAALSQALLEGNYIESFSESNNFVDGYMRYKKNASQLSPNFEKGNELGWAQQMPHESSNTDSDNEQISPPLTGVSSATSYMLDLNVEANSVYLSRPPEYLYDDQNETVQQYEHKETTVIRPSEQRELAPESGWFNASSLREENGEKEAYELLTEAYEQHQQSLLKQLLSARGLSLSWSDILIPSIRDIVTVIRPVLDKCHDAIGLDIRNYVQIKKLPGGNKEDTYLVNGIVCSKNVAHRDMAIDIENPRILLLECSIVYQRTEGRLMSLEPVMMQEQEYLRHVCTRIANLQPDVVIVQKNISRLAQDMLRKHKITLVHNVKRTVLERLARCTKADIVTAVDAHIGRPKLGTCKRFYLRSFSSSNGPTKTLMFFEGLINPYLGATILLRGAPRGELARVKQVASFLIFTAYNWRLEKSFLMDEFALPPNPRMEFLDDSRENSPQSLKPRVSIEEVMTKKHDQKPQEVFFDPLQSEPKKIIVESVNDNSDPLQSFDDTHKNALSVEPLTVTELPVFNNFKKHLDDAILCISPYIIFPVPYLETDAGRKCKLRKFFFKDMYYSEQFEANMKNNKWRNMDSDANSKEIINNNDDKDKMKPLHPFLTAKITKVDGNNVQNMLAHFRACGGKYAKKEVFSIIKPNKVQTDMADMEKSRMDVLDPMNHQRLAVLFYSFSQQSSNAPAFCVNPWVVYIDFYGNNDIPIGCFLEKYCFRSTYECPSKSCATPMVKHTRRFVHNSGSVTVTLNNFKNEFADESIVMWSWCIKCQSVSPVVPLSADSWSYSFAKYLELRFYGEIFNRRGQSPCKHSLHQDHYHYFGYKNFVASFVYSPINIWEILLPPPVIHLIYDQNVQHNALIEETKILAQKAHELFSHIIEKMSLVCGEELEGVGNVRQALVKEQVYFKQKIEDLQLKLTSPTVENKEFDQNTIIQAHWKIQDNITKIKISLIELVDSWNIHLKEATRIDKKKDKSPMPELESPSSEMTDKPITESSDVEKVESLDKSLQKGQFDSSSSTANTEESSDSKKDLFKKEKSVKNILDKLLPSSGQSNLIQSPFSADEHYNFPLGSFGAIPVFENEPSSIIAYALNSLEYKKSLEELTNKKGLNGDQTPSPMSKRRNNVDKDKCEDENKTSGLLGFLRNKESKTDLTGSLSATNEASEADQPPGAQQDKQEDVKKTKNSYIEVQFQDSTCHFFCRIYLADKFASLRSNVLSVNEETYVRSLTRCIYWKPTGGKSGATFVKTLDDRFILKEVPKLEVHMFLDSSVNYFAYMQKCHSTMQPTLLGKIVGIYQTSFKNASNMDHCSFLLVIENLFYKRDVSQKFDLKGSIRNRFVIPDNQEGEVVLLDENLLKMTCDNPLYVLPHSKEVLLAAIQNDTEFLAAQSVVDYSLLVGLDMKNKELVLGIIDYLRTFNWNKKLEYMVKNSGILGGQGKLPTIISPGEYQKRFIGAMHRYFLEVPDHYAGLGKGLDI